MTTMRISTTTLESFRLWSDPEQDWMSEDELIDTILGKFTPTPAILLGNAFGKVLESPWKYRIEGGDGYAFGEFTFTDEVMAPGLALFDYQHGVFETKVVKQYGDCTVASKADYLLGTRIDENKTTLETFDFTKYADSCQWRFYLDMFEAESITYHVFCLSDKNGIDKPLLKSIETFTFHPYAKMRQDCVELLDRFAHYVRVRGLDGVLRERQAKHEAKAPPVSKQLVLEGMQPR